VRACSLNYRDHINLKNLAGRPVAGVIPVSDGAGEVVAVGAGVQHVAVGDRVMGCFFQDWQSGRFQMNYHATALGGTGCDGMLTELADLKADGVVPIPQSLTFEEAACLPCAAVTAWTGLHRCGITATDTILTLGTGGVSVFALQLATAMGCRVLVTSSSDDKLTRALQLGASAGINYRTHPQWDAEVRRLTDHRGADVVIEVGGPQTLAQSLKSVAAGGHLALIGVLTGFGPPSESLFPLVAKNASLHGIYVGSRADALSLNHFLEQHRIRPVIDSVFEFEKATAAFEHLASGQHFGKIVIRV
jgi:NADPH:quinone reductase-like Zn-dependent oxidoreductase